MRWVGKEGYIGLARGAQWLGQGLALWAVSRPWGVPTEVEFQLTTDPTP